MKPMILPFKPAHLLSEHPMEYCLRKPCSAGLEYLEFLNLPEEVDLLDILREEYAGICPSGTLTDYFQWIFEHYAPLQNNQWLLDFCRAYKIPRDDIWNSVPQHTFARHLKDYFEKEQANEAT